MKILDRYVLREIAAPFTIALTLLTFLYQIRPMLDEAQRLLAKGVDLPTVGYLLALLIPQALGITIPMAFLAGTLMGLGRLSGDREAVALLSCGVSPLRLLRPVMILAVVVGLADMYTLVKLVPDNNQRFRVVTFDIFVKQSEGDIKPGIFYEGFPGKVLYVREQKPGTSRWSGVMLADTSQPGPPTFTFADTGYLDIDKENHAVTIVLPGESLRLVPSKNDGQIYDRSRQIDARLSVPADSVFGTGNVIDRGLPEMNIRQLREAEATRRAAHQSPHQEIMQRHQMFSFPVACLVFALLSVPLGVHTRKDGSLGGFAQGIGVIFIYYGTMQLCTALTKGQMLAPEWARWIPNIVLGIAGIIAVRWRMRSAGREMSIPIPAWVRSFIQPRKRAATRPVVILRVPDVRLPRPRLLDLYVGGRYLNIAALSFVGLVGLYYISTLIDKSERLAKGQASAWMLLQYFYYSTPQFIAYVVPMAVLVAVLATVGGLVRSGELVVMRACGVSLYRATVPLLVIAFIWSGGLFLLDDRVLAKANKQAAALEDAIRGNSSPTVELVANHNWRIDEKGRIYYYAMLDLTHQTIHGVSVLDTETEPFRPSSHAYIETATYSPKGGWRAQKGWIQHFSAADKSKREDFVNRVVRLPPPAAIRDVAKEPDLMTFGELRQHVGELKASGLNIADSRVTLQERIAFPLVTIVMTVLGIPFGATTGRRGALAGIFLALVLGTAYWLVNTFFLAVGQADLLQPVLAAWAANILFLAMGLYLTLTVRT